MKNRMQPGISHLSELTTLAQLNTKASQEAKFHSTAIDGVSLLRSDALERSSHCVVKPALCMTLQGSKTVAFGDKSYEYRAGHGLVVTLEMPERGTICAANKAKPYLGLVIELNLRVLQELVEEVLPVAGRPAKVQDGGAYTRKLNDQLIDCALRIVQLSSMRNAIATLYPGIMREICYWLLKGPGGDRLLQIMLRANGQDRRVMPAIQQLRDRFRQRIHVGELADIAHMSSTAFHRRFKRITSMAPLQYQKQLRLLEARRLMISEDATVESAAFEVGYATASQFSREYARTFGSPPRREVSSWKSPAI